MVKHNHNRAYGFHHPSSAPQADVEKKPPKIIFVCVHVGGKHPDSLPQKLDTLYGTCSEACIAQGLSDEECNIWYFTHGDLVIDAAGGLNLCGTDIEETIEDFYKDMRKKVLSSSLASFHRSGARTPMDDLGTKPRLIFIAFGNSSWFLKRAFMHPEPLNWPSRIAGIILINDKPDNQNNRSWESIFDEINFEFNRGYNVEAAEHFLLIDMKRDADDGQFYRYLRQDIHNVLTNRQQRQRMHLHSTEIMIPGKAKYYIALAREYIDRGELEDANFSLSYALKELSQHQCRSTIWRVEILIAAVNIRRGIYKEAEKDLEKLGITMAMDRQDENLKYQQESWLGIARLHLGLYERARKALMTANASLGWTDTGNVGSIVLSQRSLAICYARCSMFKQAKDQILATRAFVKDAETRPTNAEGEVNEKDDLDAGDDRRAWEPMLDFTEASVEMAMGNFSDASTRSEGAKARLANLFGEHNLQCLEVTSLSVALKSLTESSDSMSTCLVAMDLMCKHLGESHPITNSTRDSLVRILMSQARFADALEIAKSVCNHAVLTFKENYKNHPLNARYTRHLAQVQLKLGNYRKAEQIFQGLIGQTDLPDKLTLKCKVTLALAQFHMGKACSAQPGIQKCIVEQHKSLIGNTPDPWENSDEYISYLIQDILERINRSKVHPDVLYTLSAFATIFTTTSSGNTSVYWPVRIYREILKRRTQDMGPGHSDTLDARYCLGLALRQQRNWVEAEEELQKVVICRAELNQQSHPAALIANVELYLTKAFNNTAYEDPSDDIERIAAQLEQCVGRSHPDTIRSLFVLLIMRLQTNAREEVRRTQQRLLNTLRDPRIRKHRYVACLEIEASIARLYQEHHEYDAVLDSLKYLAQDIERYMNGELHDRKEDAKKLCKELELDCIREGILENIQRIERKLESTRKGTLDSVRNIERRLECREGSAVG